MLTYSFTGITDNLYEHLYKCIRDDVLSGSLPADYKLPSKRSFAKNLSVSTITVENAYNQLMSEGFIYSLPRKGFYVSEIFPGEYPAPETESSDETTHKPLSSFPSDSDYDVTGHSTSYRVDFSSNNTSPDSFPFTTWAKLTRRILSDSRDKLMTNSPSNGTLELRLAIAEYLKEFRGIYTSPDNIIVGAGTEYLYTILLQLLGGGMTYAIEKPGYRKLSMILDTVGIKSVDIPVDDKGLNVDILRRSNADIVHVTPSHHFPTGITMPVKRRYELLKWAQEADTPRYIIEDDYDSEFRLTGRPIPPLFGMDSSHVIYMNTFTKSLTSTIRISYMVLPDELAARYRERLSFYSCTVSNFEQLTLAAFISEGYFEKHINRMRTAYRRKRDCILDAIKKSPLDSVSEIKEEDAGLHFIINLKTELADNEVTDRLRKAGINLLPLSYYGSETTHSFLINYSSVPMDDINNIIESISEELNSDS